MSDLDRLVDAAGKGALAVFKGRFEALWEQASLDQRPIVERALADLADLTARRVVTGDEVERERLRLEIERAANTLDLQLAVTGIRASRAAAESVRDAFGQLVTAAIGVAL